jgi:hypothetical protein
MNNCIVFYVKTYMQFGLVMSVGGSKGKNKSYEKLMSQLWVNLKETVQELFCTRYVVNEHILCVRDCSVWCLHLISDIMYGIYVKVIRNCGIYKNLIEIHLWLGRIPPEVSCCQSWRYNLTALISSLIKCYNLFSVLHTSASLALNESWDPDVR